MYQARSFGWLSVRGLTCISLACSLVGGSLVSKPVAVVASSSVTVSTPNVLTEIADEMDRVAKWIASNRPPGEVESGLSSITHKLDHLIEQVEERGSSKPSSTSAASQVSGADQSKPQSPDQQSDQDATESPGNSGSTPPSPDQSESSPEPENLSAMLQNVWGHLPTRARESLRQVSAVKFHPKYENLIKEYFRRLAEEETHE